MHNLYLVLKKQKYLIILCLSAITYLLCLYGHALKEPNNLLTFLGGDAIKNYYAYITEVKYGESNQLAFNYPYGESYLFTDCHPFLAKTLHYAGKIFPSIEQHSTGILHILMILNLFLTYLVLFLLLRRFIKQEWYALLWVFAIMFLQPQLYRWWIGHFALSYSLAIPLCFYLLILYYQTHRKTLYAILLMVSNLLWLGTHAYLGAMTCIFTFLFDAWQSLGYKEYRNRRNLILSFGKSVLPLVMFFLYISIVDTHTGRTSDTGGFFAYNSNFRTVFMPYYEGITHFFQSEPLRIRFWESRGYIGAASCLCFWAFVLLLIRHLFIRYLKKRVSLKFPFEVGLFAPALFAGIICLFFSMGYPFKLGLESLLEYFSLIKSFRTTGRFVWPFFFVATTFSAYIYYQYLQTHRNSKMKIPIYLLLIGAPIFTMIEGIPYQRNACEHLFKMKNVFLRQNLDLEYQKALDAINPNEYQAVIPLPFYQGSENFTRLAPDHNYASGTYDIYDISNILAYHFELPLMASYLSRTSIWESRNLIQMFAPEYYKKLIAQDIPSDKKFLIICLPEPNALTPYERDFLQKATFLLKANEVEFWEISPDKMTEIVTTPHIADFNQKRTHLIAKEDCFISQPDSTVFLFSFDTHSAPYQFLGDGAYEQPEKEKQSIFAEIEPGKLDENRTYEATFWCYVGGKNFGQNQLSWKFYISQKDEHSEEVFPLLEGWSMGTPVVLGDWALSCYQFSIPNKKLTTRFAISATQCKGYQTTIDEFLIRPLDVDVYRILEEEDTEIKKLYKNGQIIWAK
ncbi:MAG: hypothetical protein FWC10_06840 [Lentimicrobiaceae bacterium]|nr:hypothetical protein [Lentimicrobiaceae bacterium]